MKKLIFTSLLLLSPGLFADEQSDLAMKLSNPVAALISVPVDFIMDENVGPDDDGELFVIKATPVLPFSFNDDWNLISRTIISYVDQDDIPGSGEGESGLSEIGRASCRERV